MKDSKKSKIETKQIPNITSIIKFAKNFDKKCEILKFWKNQNVDKKIAKKLNRAMKITPKKFFGTS